MNVILNSPAIVTPNVISIVGSGTAYASNTKRPFVNVKGVVLMHSDFNALSRAQGFKIIRRYGYLKTIKATHVQAEIEYAKYCELFDQYYETLKYLDGAVELQSMDVARIENAIRLRDNMGKMWYGGTVLASYMEACTVIVEHYKCCQVGLHGDTRAIYL